jgi:hypothetical protein
MKLSLRPSYHAALKLRIKFLENMKYLKGSILNCLGSNTLEREIHGGMDMWIRGVVHEG